MSPADEGHDPDDPSLARVAAFLRFEDSAGGSTGGPGLPRVGDVVAGFALERELGRGASGVVYAARQERLERVVALKVVAEAPIDDDPERQRRREREARLLAALHHDAIVAVHAAGAEPGLRWVAMEFIDGCTLREIMERQAPEVAAPGDRGWLPFVLDVLARLAGALEVAHAAGVVHRDVKPENVLVDRQGRAYLADFGLARDDADRTLTQGFVGTPRYAAPEQVRGEPLGPAADVFALGAVAFELVTGAPAFAGDHTQAVLRSIELDDPRWPEDARVPRDVRAVVERCLEKAVAERYADAAALAAEVDRLLRFEPVRAVPRGRLSRWWRLQRRHPGRLLAAGLVLVSLAVAGGVTWFAQGSLAAAARDRMLSDAVETYHLGLVDEAIETLAPLAAEGDMLAGWWSADMLLHRARWDEAADLYARLERTPLADLADWGRRLAGGGGRLEDDVSDGATPWEGGDTAGGGAGEASRLEPALAALAEVLRGRLDAAAGRPARAAARMVVPLRGTPSSLPWRYLRARDLLAAGQHQEALAEYRVARQINPRDTGLVRLMADLLVDMRRYEEARDLVQAALSLQPDEPVLLGKLSLALHHLGEQERALDVARQALELAPQEPTLLETYAARLTEAGRDEAAAALAAPYVRVDGQHPDWVDRTLAWIAVNRDDLDEAARLARRLIDVHDRPGRGLAVLHSVHRQREDWAAMLEVLDRLEALDPGVAAWPAERGQVLLELGRAEEARAALARSLELNPDQPSVSFLEAQLLLQLDEPFAAVLSCSRVLAHDPGDALAHYWMGFTLTRAGLYEAALRFLERPLQEWPEWWSAILQRAICESHTERLDAAADSYAEALALRDHPAVRADLADVLDQLGRDQEARDQYQRARAADPELPTAACGLGLLLLRSADPVVRDPPRALELLEEALRLAPEHPDYPGYVEEARTALAAIRTP